MIGLLRVKNEARWIERSIESILPLCDRVIVMDDHSDDDTALRCASLPGVCVFESPFYGVDEARDKNHLLSMVEESEELRRFGDWVLWIDGDEELAPGSEAALRAAMATEATCLSMRVLYLWDRPDQVRVDGVYSRAWRPSAFRFRPGLRFVSVSAAGFHCSNAPAATWSGARRAIGAPLLHYGYLDRRDRVRKYGWYNRIDPNNGAEDGYRHMVIGDLFPADAQFQHGGPLEVTPLAQWKEAAA